MDVIAKTPCICYSISIETFKVMSGEQYKSVLYLNLIKLAFSSSKRFTQISPSFIELSFPSFQIDNYQKNEVVLPSGYVKSSKIVIVIEGNAVDVKVNNYKRAKVRK
jgi:hypothetical protein